MARFRFALLLLLISFAPTARAADLAGDVRAVLSNRYFSKADVGIAIAMLGDSPAKDRILYKSNEDEKLIPASNLKLLTTSAFLDKFGGDFKFRTKLLGKDGNLYLIGDGDPTLGDAELLRKVGWDVDTVFKNWAGALKKRGLSTVRNVIVDDSIFDQEFIHPHWLARYSGARYSAQIGGVNLNANCVDFQLRTTSPGQPVSYTLDPDTHYVSVRNECVTGNRNAVGVLRVPGKNDLILRGELDANLGEPISVPIQDPPMFAATVLAETLARNGVNVTGKVARDLSIRQKQKTHPNDWPVIAVLETRLSTVLARANKDSMNLYAECLCKRLGAEVSGKPGSWENGPAAVAAFLKRIGVPSSDFHLDDGCGLSRENAISASCILTVLSHNFHSKDRQVFIDSLAVPGEEGTFKDRFRGFKGQVFGKSGYVNNVSALSGYLKGHDGQWYAFSILMNSLPGGTNNTAKAMQEKIVEAIDADVKK
jgi:D-alanyl-D-alanine carboxypeptidase/D-alanyl-D-alanine-endopeptidase (penicillin-binding protein 4)